MSTEDRRDDLPGLDHLAEDDFMQELLGRLGDDVPPPPDELSDRTIRKVQAELTSRDLIDLTTFVFLMRFCAPLLDLLAAFFGHDPLSPPESMAAPRTSATDRPVAANEPEPEDVLSRPSTDRSDPDE